jgi:hypothetical protein
MRVEKAVAGSVDGAHTYAPGEGPTNTVKIYHVPPLTENVVMANPEAPVEPVAPEPKTPVKLATKR